MRWLLLGSGYTINLSLCIPFSIPFPCRNGWENMAGIGSNDHTIVGGPVCLIWSSFAQYINTWANGWFNTASLHVFLSTYRSTTTSTHYYRQQRVYNQQVKHNYYFFACYVLHDDCIKLLFTVCNNFCSSCPPTASVLYNNITCPLTTSTNWVRAEV